MDAKQEPTKESSGPRGPETDIQPSGISMEQKEGSTNVRFMKDSTSTRPEAEESGTINHTGPLKEDALSGKTEPASFGFGAKNISFSQLKTGSSGTKSFWEGQGDEDNKDLKPQVKEPELKAKDDIKTGEENEETLFSCKAKLFSMSKGQEDWTEKGIGQLKVNEGLYHSKRISIIFH